MNQSFAIVARVDLLIFGGTSAAVSCAIEARKRGAAVMLIAPRAYLGEDIASRFRFWEKPDGLGASKITDLAGALYGDFAHPPTPMHIKWTLERAMLDADVPFLLTSSPTGALVDSDGRIRGAVIANRSGHQAILAGHVIDASLEGTLARMAGHVPSARRGRQAVEHITLCHDDGSDAPGIEVERLSGYEGACDDHAYRLSARRYRLEVDLGDGSPDAWNRASAEVVQRCAVIGEYAHQEQLTPASPPGPLKFDIELDSLTLEPGLTVLSPEAVSDSATARTLESPLAAMLIASRMGSALPVGDRELIDPSELNVRCHSAEPVKRGEIRMLTHALRPGCAGREHIRIEVKTLPRLGGYEVLVIGGGTGGAPAAIAAAKAVASTAIIESGPALGGVGTLGQITRYWFGNRVGFTSIIDQGVRELEYHESIRNHKSGWSISAKSAYLHRRCHEEGVSLWFRSMAVGVWVEGERVRGVVVAGPHGYGLLESKVVIDSTGCADIPAAAGAPTMEIGDEHVAVQGTGLAGMDPGRDYRNSDHNFCDDTDVLDTTAFFVSSRKKFMTSFDAGQLVDSRERRQIVGELTLEPVDFLFERRFPDTICIASSNFDSHGFTIHPIFTIKPPNKERLWVDVPYRCLLPRGIDGVLVTGLGVSAHRDAIPVIRMQADVQNQGYAAGYAAAMAVHDGVSIRQIDIRKLQRHLVEIGNLPERVLSDADSFPIDDARLDEAVAEHWDDYGGLALIFSDPERSVPRLLKALEAPGDADRRERYALILALMDEPAGEPLLREAVTSAHWDEGWNYRGMGQFGMSLSPLDARIVGLGRVGGAAAWTVLEAKIEQLIQRAREADTLPEFSHCHALTLAFESLWKRHPNPDAPRLLAQLLDMPGITGHAHTSLSKVLSAVTDDPNENDVRNRALRELHLGRALLRIGDLNGRGRAIVQHYANDLRGHFARHARAVLQAAGGDEDGQPAPGRHQALTA
ncbi:MAG: FAD-dependent oxidoreductase [Phycisphaeraceae bacterium]|nr:FAD-dependent oxidoreductase [Phycisphaeraceae bacterium]